MTRVSRWILNLTLCVLLGLAVLNTVKDRPIEAAIYLCTVVLVIEIRLRGSR